MSKVIIVGGGAAGMFAAVHASDKGHEVHLFEKNEKLGKKLYITGKGRCNITNACDVEELFQAVIGNPKFLYSSFYTYTNQNVIDFFENEGLATKIERGNRVFPVSDHSSDVIRTLSEAMRKRGVQIHLNQKVEKVLQKDGTFDGIVLEDGKIVKGDSCIIATGGLSYPSTGSTGDGYRWAEALGHKVTERSPGLVPLETKEPWVKTLQGLSLRNVNVTVLDGRKKYYEEFGELLFTHFGVSGPLVLTASTCLGKYQKELEAGELKLFLDLKASLTPEQLDKRFLREFDTYRNKNISNVMERLLPKKMIPVFLDMAQIPEDKKIRDISKKERRRMIELMKNFEMHISGVRGFNEAIVTRGGVNVKEINPATMESKKVKHLFFAGEIMDLDAVTGGYNLQIAWTTGYAAGKNA